MALFSKKKSDDPNQKSTAPDGAPEDGREFPHDLKKSGKFLTHARSTADARNYDYSVECYINGLRFNPDNLNLHEELREVALKRKVAGGKPMRIKSLGKDPICKMLDAEKAMALEPLNFKHLIATVERAADVHEAFDNLAMGDFGAWLGRMALELLVRSKKADKKMCLRLIDALRQIGAFETAAQACRLAIQLDPKDQTLISRLRDMETEQAMVKGRYSEKATDAVRDQDQVQRLMDEGESTGATEDTKSRIIAGRRSELEADPDNVELLIKLVEALRAKETEATEAEAIQLLNEGYEKTSQYRLKMIVGDIRIKQLTRQLRESRSQLKQQPKDESLKNQFQAAAKRLLVFKLDEFAQRVKNYPTNMPVRYEYGVCLFQAGRYEDAIGAFQQAQADPKARTNSRLYLGRSYLHQQWYDEAIDTLAKAVKEYEFKDNQLAKELLYYHMDALWRKACESRSLKLAEEAREVASELLQIDINFRDIRQRVNQIRDLINELREQQDDRKS